MPIKKEVTIGDCRLILGDCLDVMPYLEGVDACVCDPPYGIGASSKKFTNGNSKTAQSYSRDVCWDTKTPDRVVMDSVLKKAKSCIIWGGNYFNLPPSRGFLIWDKTIHGNSYADCEMAWCSMDMNARIKPLNMVATTLDGRVHPTQKPVKLMEWCITHLPKDTETILDPFMGSASTLVACAKMGRKSIGIELDPDYFEIACKRVQEAYDSPDMFVAAPPKIEQDKLF